MERKIRGTWMDDPAHFRRRSRRDFMYVGLLGGLGLTLPEFLRMEAMAAGTDLAAKGSAPAKSVIHIYLPGGAAQQETFDPKPHAPVEYRGDLKSIETAIPGVRFNQYLPHTAKIANKITVCRGMSHSEAAHERGTSNMFTGYRPSPALEYPCMGSVVSHELGAQKGLPPYVAIPNMPQSAPKNGYLSSAYGPFSVGSDPASNSFKVRDLNLPGGIDDSRFTRRRNLLDAVDAHFTGSKPADNVGAMSSFYEHAYNLVGSVQAREAFNINAEPDAVRDRYGRNQAGQRMLLARRLIEAGTRFVSLTYGGWDMHGRIRDGIARTVPPLDQAFATLILDLEERGLLDSTLVMISSEFGRTPKINKDAGRDHWPKVFSVVLAGGGIRKGCIFGESDAIAAEPDHDSLSVEDLAMTVYNRMGIDASKELMAPGDRPIEIVKDGKVVDELIV
ncbi:hypothetical protein Pan216_50330 [Planctomycetes bacterium Pan216]|uniref:Sulfatase n=1 Tax=Kolteria novifilia TaxID=2527975 RepID=A0A518BAY4_9BACT|nr:hypothetical protein Pan216_50330 [Planctomycetes bacterium Pan216]